MAIAPDTKTIVAPHVGPVPRNVVQEIAGRFILNQAFRELVRTGRPHFEALLTHGGALEAQYGPFDSDTTRCLVNVLAWLDDSWDTTPSRYALVVGEYATRSTKLCCDNPPC